MDPSGDAPADPGPGRLEDPVIAAPRGGRTLALETSGLLAGVAVTEDGALLGESSLDTRRAPTEHLLVNVRRLLDDLGLAIADLDRIAYSEGPGSFTGLRVGMATALGLAIGADLPLVAVPTLEVLAFPWRTLTIPLIPLSGHRRGLVYQAAYLWTGERFDCLLDPASVPVAEMLDRCGSLTAPRLLFAGDALDSLAEAIHNQFGEKALFAPREPARAAAVAALAADPGRPEWTGMEREGRTPLYLRDADARRPKPRIHA